MSAATHNRGPRTLNGVQKVAVLCMALGPKAGSRVLQQLSSDEVEMVTREIAALPAVEKDVVEAVLKEYESAARSAGPVARGGMHVAQELLEETLGASQARPVVEQLQGQVCEPGLTRLKRATPEVLLGVLRGEHPQSIALVLAHLDPRQAAVVVQALEPGLAADVLLRMTRLDRVAPEMLALAESVLSRKVDLAAMPVAAARGGAAAVARLLNLAGSASERDLLEALQARNPDTTQEIKSLMFVFEDLLLIGGKGIQRLLREIEGKELALALKAASAELKKHLKSNMSERAAEALEEEVEMMGPVRVKDVEAAHAHIVEALRSLGESGEILIPGRGGSDDIIA